MVNNSDGNPEDEELGTGAPGGEEPSPSDGWDIGGPLGFETASGSRAAGMSFELEGFENPSSSLSMDDFDGEAVPFQGPSAQETAAGPRELEEYEAPPETPGGPEKRRRRKRIILAVSLLACIGIATAIAVPAYKAMKPKGPTLVGKKDIRHSLVIPEFQEEFDFLVLATSEQDRNLLSIRLSFVFSASNAFEQFSEQATSYRDAVYQYLLRARPARNSQKLWQGILEKQLSDYLKQTFPRSGLQTIRVAHWERH